MFRIHPAISSFPVAFLLLVCILEFWAAFTRNSRIAFAASVVLIAGSVATLATFLSGYHASAYAGELSESTEAALSFHHALGRVVLIGMIVTLAFHVISKIATHNQKLFRTLYCLMLGVTMIALVYTAHEGGGLVFNLGVGVVK